MPTFAVTAHEFPAQLGRLARRLEPHPMIVHINARVDQTPFEKAVADRSHVTFLPASQRVSVNWAGMSMVRALRAQLRAAVDGTAADDHIVVLSGTDYLLRPVDEFARWLRDAPYRQHIRYFDVAHSDDHQRKLTGRRHYRDVTAFPRARRGSLRADVNEATKRGLSSLMRWKPPTPCPGGMRPMRGGLWCALTAGCVADVLDLSTPALDRWMERVFCPDEVYLHTLVAATRHGDDTELSGPMPYPGKLPGMFSSLHLIDDSLDKFFTISDLPLIETSDKWFVRKVAPPASDSLLDALDELAGVPRPRHTSGGSRHRRE